MRFLLSLILLACAATAARAQVVLTPMRDLAPSGGGPGFASVTGMSVSKAGVIAVSEGAQGTIRFFDARGIPAGTFDGGDFTRLAMTTWIGDTLVAGDAESNRLTWIGPDRKLLRTLAAPPRLLAPADATDQTSIGTRLALWSILPDGSLLGFGGPAKGAPAWFPADHGAETNPLQFTAEGRFVRMPIDFRRDSLMDRCQHAQYTPDVPFCAQWRSAINPLTGFVSVGRSNTAGFFHLRVVGTGGTVTLDREYPYSGMAIPAPFIDSMRIARAANPEASAKERSEWPTIPFPRAFPPIAGVLLGNDGTVWLDVATPAAPKHDWRVLDARGELIGILTLPRNIRLMVVTRTKLWGVEAGADGLAHLVRYTVK